MLFLDMDGCVANFVKAACAAHGRDTSDVDEWNFFTKWGIDENQFWEPVNAGGREFWANLEPYEWFDELVGMVKKADPNFYILTKPSRQASCLAGKLDWIHRHFGKGFRNYIFAPDKSPLAAKGRLLIDDSDDNCHAFSAAGGKFILFPQPWNKARNLYTPRMKWVAENLEYRKDWLCVA